jgi:hypothetical protein
MDEKRFSQTFFYFAGPQCTLTKRVKCASKKRRKTSTTFDAEENSLISPISLKRSKETDK